MSNLADLAQGFPFRGLVVGYPGSAKTGALAALANAGLKLRILAFDKKGNMQPLIQYTKPEFWKNIDIQMFEDKMGLKPGAKQIEVMGLPSAFADALKMADHWKYKNDKGEEVDLGRSKDWGLDTVLVLDSLTSMGDSAMRRARAVLNSTSPVDDRVYGLAMREQEAFVELMMTSSARHHSIVISHLRIVGPKDVRKGDSPIMMAQKEAIADLVPTRLYPSALGWQLPQQIGRHFPTIIEARTKLVGGKMKRVLKTVTELDLDVKLPTSVDVAAELPVSTGMVTIFDAVSPGWRAAVEASAQG